MYFLRGRDDLKRHPDLSPKAGRFVLTNDISRYMALGVPEKISILWDELSDILTFSYCRTNISFVLLEEWLRMKPDTQE